MTAPKISIIIVYNNKKQLRSCIESAVQQSFSNIEAVCTDNGSKDGASKIASELAEKIDRIKLISIPSGLSAQEAKRAGLSAAEGEFAVFIENNEIVPPDFIKNLYIEAQKKKKIEIKDKCLYRRSFIENDSGFASLISDTVNKSAMEQEKKIQKEFDNFGRNNTENVRNSTYEILTRFNALEKQFYAKDWEYQERIKSYENTIRALSDERTNKIYEDMQKIYDYINAQISIKGADINEIYNEITKNYKYTEKYAEDKAKWALETMQSSGGDIKKRIDELEKEVIVRYQNLKRIMDIQFDEIKERLKGG